MKQFNLYLFALLMYLQLQAQSQVLSLQENELKRARNLSAFVYVFGADIYNPNLNFFAEGGLQYRTKGEYGFVRANYRIAFLDRIESIDYVDGSAGLPANGTQALKLLEGTVGYNFIRKEKTAIASKRFAGKAKDNNVPVNYLRCYGVHVGYGTFRTIIAQGSTIDYTGELRAIDGLGTLTAEATPMLNMTLIHAGIHRFIIHDYALQATENGFNEKTVGKTCSYLYADFYFAPSMVFDDVLVPLGRRAPNSDPNYTNRDGYNFYAMDINNGRRKVPIGGRIGIESNVLKSVGLTLGAEAGFRPGVFDPSFNMYLMAKIGFSINARLK